ncbi:unnamed protein product [Camellia sinensis]
MMKIEMEQALSLFRKIMKKIYKYLYDVLTKDFDSSFPQERENNDREAGFEQALRSCTTISRSGLVSVKSNSRKKEKAVLPLRCKILNIERGDEAAMYKNEEIQNLILALGLGVKRYGEVTKQRLDLAVLVFLQHFRKSYVGDQAMHSSKLHRDKKEQWGSYFSLVIHLRAIAIVIAIAIAIAISKFSLSTDFEAPPPPPSSTKVSSPILIVKRARSYAWTQKLESLRRVCTYSHISDWSFCIHRAPSSA